MRCAASWAPQKIIGIDISHERLKLAKHLGVCDVVLVSGPDNVSQVRELTGGHGSRASRSTALQMRRLVQPPFAPRASGGKMVMVGEGGTVTFNPSPDIIHDQKAIYGSWVTSTWLMEELVERLVRWKLHPEAIITHRFPLERASDAYALMASGHCGKVAVCPEKD